MNTSNSFRILMAAVGLAAASVIFVQWRPSARTAEAPMAPAMVEVEGVSAAAAPQAPVAASATTAVSPQTPVATVSAAPRVAAPAVKSADRKLEDIKPGEYAVNLVEDDTELAYQLGQDLGSMPADEVARWKALRAQHVQDEEAGLGGAAQ